MLQLPVAFTSPLILIFLLGLPVLYYVLRVRPPQPRIFAFPPLRLLQHMLAVRQVAVTTPWWVLLLRMVIAACVICAAAGPILNPITQSAAVHGSLILLLDDDWAAAPTWMARRDSALEFVAQAERQGQMMVLLRGSEVERDAVMSDAAHLREQIYAITPVSFLTDHEVVRDRLAHVLERVNQAQVVWVSNGVAGFGAEALAHDLALWHGQGRVSAQIISDKNLPPMLMGFMHDANGFDVRVRGDEAHGRQGVVRALDAKGRVMARVPFASPQDEVSHVHLTLPLELRNEVARFDLEGEQSAGAVWLVDAGARRVRMGLVSDEAYDLTQPLLSAAYYITKAMQPFADIEQPRDDVGRAIDRVLSDHPALLVLADVGILNPQAHRAVQDFVRAGGVLLRFAGPHMLAGSDDLVPVRLRRGGRVMGGSLSWEQPKHIAPVDAASPLYGMAVPQDVVVHRQLLAEPDAGLRAATWMALEDGTPLISATSMGQGLVVLVHVTADTNWSNLPLSGVFVDVLRRVVDMAQRRTAQADDQNADSGQGAEAGNDGVRALVAPLHVLDGFGTLGAASPRAQAIDMHFDGPVSAAHPAGYYGARDGIKALNALQRIDAIAALDAGAFDVPQGALMAPAPIGLRGFLLSLAAVLLLLDGLVHMNMQGLLRWRGVALMLVGALCFYSFGRSDVWAQNAEQADVARARTAALSTHLAYVMSGVGKVDETSRAGLVALSQALAARTSLQPTAPIGVDIARDELSFYPLLYWPIVAEQPQPSARAVANMARYMRQGGTIVFDTRDALRQRVGYVTPEGEWLRQVLAGVDIPPLQIVPVDHVVTKTFYLLTHFVGRTAVGETWIEALPPAQTALGAAPVRAGDNVSPLIITSNDLAGAWATNAYGAPLYPLIPNDERQREMALRGGINLVMYTLTGNYKADQVHVRDLLERLGR